MDEDVPMDQDEPEKPSEPKAPKGDDLEQYNLDDYDNDDAMPGTFTSHKTAYVMLAVHYI